MNKNCMMRASCLNTCPIFFRFLFREQIDKGTSFGAPCALENTLADMVIEAVPSVEMVRFCNSGTEACMGALRLMRAYTGNEYIIKFEGCYHGHADSFLVKAGSGVLTLGLPDSPGVPKAATQCTLCATYNDIESVRQLFETYKGQIAGVCMAREECVYICAGTKSVEGIFVDLVTLCCAYRKNISVYPQESSWNQWLETVDLFPQQRNFWRA